MLKNKYLRAYSPFKHQLAVPVVIGRGSLLWPCIKKNENENLLDLVAMKDRKN